MNIIGRICVDNEQGKGKLMPTAIGIEGGNGDENWISRGTYMYMYITTAGVRRVKLRLDASLNKLQLFPGQVVGVQGEHITDTEFLVKKFIDVCCTDDVVLLEHLLSLPDSD